MFGLIKMSALSAVLSFGVVSAYEQAGPAAPQTGSGKIFHDRILPDGAASAGAAERVSLITAQAATATQGSKGDRLDARHGSCGEAWPYYTSSCLSRDDGSTARNRVRLITVETREGNTSVLRRVSPADIAQR